MNVVLCAIVVIWETALGRAMLVSCYPGRRFKNRLAKVMEWICFAVICGLYTWNDTYCFVGNLMVLIIGAMGAVYVFSFYQCKFSVSFIGMQLYFILMSLLRTPYVVGRGLVLECNLVEANYGSKSWSGFLYEVVFLILVSIFFETIWKKHSTYARKVIERSRIFLLCIAIAAWELMSYVLFSGTEKYSGNAFYFLIWGSAGVLFALVCLGVYWMYQNERNEKRMLLFQQTRLAERQMEQRKVYEEHERRIHDMKHVLLFLQQCIEEEKCDRALQKIEDYQEVMRIKKVWTKNINVDSVINSKWAKLEEGKIEFQLEADFFVIPIDELDFSIILGTLLDNAIEAAQQCEIGRRKIKLLIRAKNKMFGMTLWNTSSRMPEVKRGKLQTTKKDKELHGWGMESVKDYVEKYDGELYFRYDEKFFEVKVIFTGGGNKE